MGSGANPRWSVGKSKKGRRPQWHCLWIVRYTYFENSMLSLHRKSGFPFCACREHICMCNCSFSSVSLLFCLFVFPSPEASAEGRHGRIFIFVMEQREGGLLKNTKRRQARQQASKQAPDRTETVSASLARLHKCTLSSFPCNFMIIAGDVSHSTK